MNGKRAKKLKKLLATQGIQPSNTSYHLALKKLKRLVNKGITTDKELLENLHK